MHGKMHELDTGGQQGIHFHAVQQSADFHESFNCRVIASLEVEVMRLRRVMGYEQLLS